MLLLSNAKLLLCLYYYALYAKIKDCFGVIIIATTNKDL